MPKKSTKSGSKTKREVKRTTQREDTFYREVPSLSGVKTYEFEALRRKEAMFIAHTSLKVVLGALGNVAGLMLRNIEKEDTETRGAILRGVVEGMAALDFETVWGLAEAVFRNVAVPGEGVIEDINESDYFPDNLDEFYIALIIGIGGNFPDVFSKFREMLDGIDLPENLNGLKDLLDSSKESNIR